MSAAYAYLSNPSIFSAFVRLKNLHSTILFRSILKNVDISTTKFHTILALNQI